MIHLEILLDSPFQSIGILRYYANTPQNLPAFDLRLDFDFAMVLLWHPRRRTATLKALRRPPASQPVDLKRSQEIGEFIYTHTGSTQVSWERAKGKRYTLHRHGPGRWKLLPPRPVPSLSAPAEPTPVRVAYHTGIS